jgi:hypothetical protein
VTYYFPIYVQNGLFSYCLILLLQLFVQVFIPVFNIIKNFLDVGFGLGHMESGSCLMAQGNARALTYLGRIVDQTFSSSSMYL